VRLWDLKTHSQIATLMGHLGPVRAVAFHPSGQALLSSGQDQTVRVWDVRTRTQQRDLEGSWEIPAISRFAADLTMTVLEGNSGIQVFSGAGVKKSYPEATALAMTRDGATLAFGKADGSVWLDRGAQKEKEVARIPTRVRGLVFSGDGTVLAIQTADARTVRIVSIDSEGNANPGGEFTTEEPSWFVALDDSGNSIAMCGKRNGVVYSRDNSSAAMRIRSSTDIIGITYDAFRQLVLLYTDRSVEFFGSPMPPAHLRSSAAGNSQLAAVSENGKVFAFAQRNGDVYVWSGGGAPLHFTLPEQLLAMSFSRDGNQLGTLDRRGAVRIYDIRIAERNAGAVTGVLPSEARP
jgi:WD40 repeat protein